MSNISLKIGDLRGKLLAESRVSISTVAWRLNDVARVPIVVAREDALFQEPFWRPGNRVYMEFANGLPAWGGILDVPESWTGDLFETTAYSGEALLSHRQTDRGRYFKDASPGAIFRDLVGDAIAIPYPWGLTIGTAEEGETFHSPEYHFKDILWIVRDSLASIAGTDFWVEPLLEGGRISFKVHQYKRRGNLLPGITLLENHNVADIRFRRQGPIVNWWDVAGAGSGWDSGRLYSQKKDRASIDKYGLRQASAVLSNIKSQETLDNATRLMLEKSKEPRPTWALKALNKKPAPFDAYDIGDVIRLETPNYDWNGFSGFVRVQTREFNTANGLCELVVEQVYL